MDINTRLKLSYYKTISDINSEHGVFLVQHIETKRIYVKKVLTVYNYTVYEYLLNHPISHVPYIHELIEDDSTLYVIEDFISGEGLDSIISNGPCSEKYTIWLISELCKIVSEFHKCNPAIIHRDIKPSNIIVNSNQELFLLDFNAAKYSNDEASRDTVLLGTHGYAAPEQYGFGASSVQTDIYSIGVLMNTMLTGTLSNECTVNGRLAPIITKCMSLNPADRFDSISALMDAIYAAQYAPGGTTARKTYQEPVTKHSIHDYDKESSVRRFLPPGFRTLTPWKMIVSALVYAFIAYFCATYVPDNAVSYANIIFERIFTVGALIGTVLFVNNYLNIHSKLPLCKSSNMILKTIGIIAGAFIIIVGVIIVMVELELLIFF